MKKHTLKKLMSLGLVSVMLVGMIIAALPVNAAVDTPINLVPNEDNWVNGVKIRFETSGTDSYAKIQDGKLVLKMKYGDLLWFPDLTIKDTTSSLVYEMTADKDDILPYVVTGIEPKGTEKRMYAQTFGSWGKWVCARMSWLESGDVLKTDAAGDYWYRNDFDPATTGITTLPGSAILKTGDVLTTTTTFTQGAAAIRPVTSFKEANVDTAYVHTYADKEDVNPNGSFGIAARSGDMCLSLDKVVATNINGIDGGSYTEDFETIDSYSGPIINMRQAGTSVEFDSGIAFVEFKFMIDAGVTTDTEFVVKKNGTEIDRRAISSFTAVENVYTYETHFTPVEDTDLLSVCLMKDGSVLPNSSYEIDYGAQYKDFVDNPPPVTSATLINEVYSENFDDTEGTITLQPGENDVNGTTWTYIKNSADGSAVIKGGRLYFTGSKNDMILIDVNLDKQSYRFQYEVNYLDTPADDIWTDWTCWFGSLIHMQDADAEGNRHAFITSVTPNDVYMMQGAFDASGAFVREDKTDHVTFQNKSAAPTQPGELYYWDGRIGNGTPAKIANYVGVDGYDYGQIGISGYGVTGGHRVSANMPGTNTLDQRVGKIGFVCSDSQTRVMVDNIVINSPGKNITVDGEVIQVSASGEINVSALQKDDKKLVYATVDGVAKYMGDTFSATRLTEIFTTQIELTTKKVKADGQTGLKWTTEISKADLDALKADPKISSVDVGTVVVPTSVAKNGITVDTATSNIAGTATESGSVYSFDGVLSIEKADRDTSYSGIGYIKVTMADGSVVYVYSDYTARNHAYALSDLVDEFDDEEETESDTEIDTEIDTEEDTEIDTEEDTEVDTDTDTEEDTDTDTEENTDTDTEEDTEEDTETETDIETDTESEFETETEDDKEPGFFGKIFGAIGNFFKSIWDWFIGLFS